MSPKAAKPQRDIYRRRRMLHRHRTIAENSSEHIAAAFDPEALEQFESVARAMAGENEKLRESVARQRAEFDNFRKRVQREKDQIREAAVETILSKILPVLDNFERAIESATPAADPASIRQGIQMVSDQLNRIVEGEGLQRVEARDAPFNPAEHEALAVEERADVPENRVVGVLLPGYRFKGRIIRPAMVKVSKAPQSPSSE